jgi:hypothetical protein
VSCAQAAEPSDRGEQPAVSATAIEREGFTAAMDGSDEQRAAALEGMIHAVKTARALSTSDGPPVTHHPSCSEASTRGARVA